MIQPNYSHHPYLNQQMVPSKGTTKLAKSQAIRLAIVFAGVLLTRPFCTTVGLSQLSFAYWMVAIPIFYLLFIKEVLKALQRGFGMAIVFYAFIAAHMVFDFTTTGTSPNALITKNGLLLSTFTMFVVLKDDRTMRKSPEVFYWFVERLTLFLCFYGFYQAVAFKLGLPVFDAGLIRGRTGGLIPQVCGLFEEPAFFAQYLLAALFILLGRADRVKPSTLVIILVSMLLSRSVGGLLGCTALLINHLFATGMLSIKGKVKPSQVLVSLVGIAIAVVLAVKTGAYHNVATRLEREVFEHAAVIGTDHYVSGSGGGRVINEINMLLATLKTSPWMGMGVDTAARGRLMGLNAVAESVFRYGLIGFVLISSLFVESRYKLKRTTNGWAYWGFLAVFFAVDGAIAKPIFWLLLSIVSISEAIKSDESVKPSLPRQPSLKS